MLCKIKFSYEMVHTCRSQVGLAHFQERTAYVVISTWHILTRQPLMLHQAVTKTLSHTNVLCLIWWICTNVLTNVGTEASIYLTTKPYFDKSMLQNLWQAIWLQTKYKPMVTKQNKLANFWSCKKKVGYIATNPNLYILSTEVPMTSSYVAFFFR